MSEAVIVVGHYLSREDLVDACDKASTGKNIAERRNVTPQDGDALAVWVRVKRGDNFFLVSPGFSHTEKTWALDKYKSHFPEGYKSPWE